MTLEGLEKLKNLVKILLLMCRGGWRWCGQEAAEARGQGHGPCQEEGGGHQEGAPCHIG